MGKWWKSCGIWCVALLLIAGIIPGKALAGTPDFSNPVLSDGADPYAVFKDGYYYYTHTTGGDVTIWKTKSLTNLETAQKKTIWRTTDNPGLCDGANCTYVWAPELHYTAGKWYLYVALDFKVYAFEANTQDPMGAYALKGLMTSGIDATLFELNGKTYFMYNDWLNGTNGIFIHEMSNPYTLTSKRTRIAVPTYNWEINPNSQGGTNEGAAVLIRNGKVFIIYSANDWMSENYCLGLLTASASSDLFNTASWTKSANPIFQKNSANGVYGPGHNSFVKSPDGTEDWNVYHAKKIQAQDGARNVRIQKVTWNPDGSPNLGIPLALSAKQLVPSGDQQIRYEAEDAKINHAATASDPNASGGSKAAYIDYSDSYVEYSVKVPSSGTYSMKVRYHNDWGTSTHNVSVNGGSGTALSYGSGYGTAVLNVNLNAGSNTIRFSKGSSFAELDYIDIPLRHEAEKAVLNHAGTASDNTASGGQKAGYIDYADSYAEFSVNVPAAGTYNVQVRYHNDWGASTHNVSVNGGAGFSLSYGSGWNITSFNVSLNKGYNKIRFSKGSSYTELDYIEVAYP
ncbi:family 43 glycosylhydrolase [Paenibacillus gansuensis]|uniref:Family 43 glycosylhydrolase n=1 Tax=Paenibacillus gansuensis TaxID=306542 RepID=A0ABW5P9N5_9BACL